MKFQMKSTAKAVALGIVTLAASAAFATQTPVEFDLKGHDEFVKSLGKDAIAPQQRTAEESKAILAKVYNEKLEQHVSSFHYEKGVTCISCHDQQKQGGPDWMVPVTNPPMKKECGDCHETQAYVVSHTKSHSKYECTVCHMPNTAAGPNDGSNGKMDAVRRLHTYKINVSPDASTWTKDKDGAWVLSKDEDGHGYVDLMWSCARNAPADYTVAEGRGCHSKATSELDPGLVYQDEKEVYGEVMKWQKPVKDGYEQIKGGVERVSKLLEVTALPYEKQTQIRLLLDKATEVSDLIEKDGKIVVQLPGPPHEMADMFGRQVYGRLAKKTGGCIASRFIRIYGMGESQVAQMCAQWIENGEGVTVAPYCALGECQLRVTARGGDEAEALRKAVG